MTEGLREATERGVDIRVIYQGGPEDLGDYGLEELVKTGVVKARGKEKLRPYNFWVGDSLHVRCETVGEDGSWSGWTLIGSGKLGRELKETFESEW